MGIFTAPKPAYEPPELPFASTSRRRESSTVGHRRPSFFPAHSAQNIHRDSHTGPISPPLPSPSAVGYFERRPSFFSRPSASSIHHDPPSPGLVHPERRPSFFPRASGSIVHRDSHTAHHRPSDPAITTTVQTTFLGRRVSQAIVPAFMRKASLATAARDRNPSHLRMGETYNDGEDNMADAFYRSRLSVDEVDSEDEKMALQEKIYQLREAKGKEREQGGVRGGWQSKLGWDAAPPKGKKGRNRDPDEKKRSGRKHRQKRVMRELDSDLDAFNVYSQNGLATLTRSRTDPAISIHGSQPSLVSIQESVHSQVTSLAPGPLDNADSILIAEAESRPKAVPVGDGFDALDIMADHIFRIGVQRKKWFKAPKLGMKRDGVATGVSIRAKTGLYRTYPVDYEPLEEFEDAITRLNPEVAIKINSQIVRTIMRTYIDPHISMSELILDANTRIQILDTIPNLARARKHQYAAFIRSEGVLCVWADIVEEIVPAAEALEEALIHFIWRGEEENRKINQAIQIDEQEKKEEGDTQSMKEEEDMDPEDVEMRRVKRHWRERPTNLFAPMIDGMAIMVCLAVIGLGLRTLVVEYALDGQPLRFVLVIFAPALCCVAAFACSCLVGSFWQILGPIRQCTQNSMYYSGIAPKRTMGELSHVTIQMPVYKESLDEVIRPTIESLKRAITTYERQGGSASVIMCDDGLQLLSQEEADERRRFYFDNNIAYCSRPGHNVNGFIRKGRFKKAGNLNYANALSLRIEEVLDELRPDAHAEKGAEHFWSDNDENALYEIALTQVLEEKQGQAWAAGNLRMGSILLIIDSDTRVPEDCFADAVSEMAESPEVAVIQHMSGVMQVAHHFFENGVAHFTRGIQTAISYCCASGEVAPFVGHNAFLRWSALQECMTVDPDDGVRKIWSEDHVSEDFQIAVQLQIKGYVVRWASYTGGEFEEGVSLTCDDEINRWQKYAFGCSELVFHPIKNWWRRGPVTPLYRQFLWSNIPIHSKLTISGYIFSYYAISCAWFLTVVNFFIRGWNIPVDGYYLPSWNVLIVCLVLFGVLSNVAFIVIRYRLKTPDAAEMSFAQIKWIPFFLIFFSGMSMPMSAALASHLVGYNMTWSTTVKTVQKSNFFLQVPLIWKRFWPQLSFFTVMIAGMIVLSQVPAIPAGWQIYSIEVTVPLGMIAAAHILYPFALNPWFLSFSF